MTKRKTHTSTEVKERWKKKTYKRYSVNLRKVEDKELIDYVEEHKEDKGVTDYFRDGVQKAIDEGKK